MIEQLIRESSYRLLKLISEASDDFQPLLDVSNLELIDEAIDILTDETIKNFDDYIDLITNTTDDESE